MLKYIVRYLLVLGLLHLSAACNSAPVSSNYSEPEYHSKDTVKNSAGSKLIEIAGREYTVQPESMTNTSTYTGNNYQQVAYYQPAETYQPLYYYEAVPVSNNVFMKNSAEKENNNNYSAATWSDQFTWY